MSSSAMVAVGNGTGEKRYPKAVASHDDVVKDPLLFWDTLRHFHSVLGTKYMVPVIGGKELNLHVLYVEVTKRGGYDQVVIEKKWREVSCVFNFSPTTTSASYALRKHYFGLLHHYEQVYFFKLQAPLLTSPGSFSCGPEMTHHREYSSKGTGDFLKSKGGGPSCFRAIGTIDGKFDCGYLISVRLGSEILNGVLYHPEQSPPQPSSSCTAIVPYGVPNRRRHSRRRRRRWDPTRPKPNRSGYNFFFAEKHSSLKSLYPEREREFTKMIGESWSSLSQEERMVYQDYGLKDKERYQREMKEYKEGLKMRQSMDVS